MGERTVIWGGVERTVESVTTNDDGSTTLHFSDGGDSTEPRGRRVGVESLLSGMVMLGEHPWEITAVAVNRVQRRVVVQGTDGAGGDRVVEYAWGETVWVGES